MLSLDSVDSNNKIGKLSEDWEREGGKFNKKLFKLKQSKWKDFLILFCKLFYDL